MKLFYVAKTQYWGVDKDAVSYVADRDSKRRSWEEGDDDAVLVILLSSSFKYR